MTTRPKVLKGVRTGGHSTILEGLESLVNGLKKIDGVKVITGRIIGRGVKNGPRLNIEETDSGFNLKAGLSRSQQKFRVILECKTSEERDRVRMGIRKAFRS